jgi:hypothetical protein
MAHRAWTRRTDCLDRSRRGGRKGPPLDHSNKRLVRHFVHVIFHCYLFAAAVVVAGKGLEIWLLPNREIVLALASVQYVPANGMARRVNAMADLPVVRFVALV